MVKKYIIHIVTIFFSLLTGSILLFWDSADFVEKEVKHEISKELNLKKNRDHTLNEKPLRVVVEKPEQLVVDYEYACYKGDEGKAQRHMDTYKKFVSMSANHKIKELDLREDLYTKMHKQANVFYKNWKKSRESIMIRRAANGKSIYALYSVTNIAEAKARMVMSGATTGGIDKELAYAEDSHYFYFFRKTDIDNYLESKVADVINFDFRVVSKGEGFFFRASLVTSERDVIQMQFIEEEYQRELVKHGKEKAPKLISNPVKIRRKIRK